MVVSAIKCGHVSEEPVLLHAGVAVNRNIGIFLGAYLLGADAAAFVILGADLLGADTAALVRICRGRLGGCTAGQQHGQQCDRQDCNTESFHHHHLVPSKICYKIERVSSMDYTILQAENKQKYPK